MITVKLLFYIQIMDKKIANIGKCLLFRIWIVFVISFYILFPLSLSDREGVLLFLLSKQHLIPH